MLYTTYVKSQIPVFIFRISWKPMQISTQWLAVAVSLTCKKIKRNIVDLFGKKLLCNTYRGVFLFLKYWLPQQLRKLLLESIRTFSKIPFWFCLPVQARRVQNKNWCERFNVCIKVDWKRNVDVVILVLFTHDCQVIFILTGSAYCSFFMNLCIWTLFTPVWQKLFLNLLVQTR